jgi:hypothetical protein
MEAIEWDKREMMKKGGRGVFVLFSEPLSRYMA